METDRQPERFALRLARVPQALAVVRRELRRWLDEGGVDPEDVVDITLACSEACSNAVEHPGRSGTQAFEVEAERDRDELLLAVHDFGLWNVARATDTRGRGLSMIRAVMDAVEITSGRDGTRVVMRRSLRHVG